MIIPGMAVRNAPDRKTLRVNELSSKQSMSVLATPHTARPAIIAVIMQR